VEIRRALRRRWYILVVGLSLSLLAAFVVDRGAPSSFRATGVVMVADPLIDPARSVLRGIEIPSVTEGATDPDVRERVVAAGGVEDYEVRSTGPRRIQVLASADLTAATTTVEVVLRHLERAVLEEQTGSGRAADERVRSRLLLDVPEGAVVSERDTVQVVGTLILQDPLIDSENPFGSGNATRLLSAAVTSDAERQRIGEMLGDGVDFGLATYDRGSSGMLELAIVGPESQPTIEGFDTLVEVLTAELEERQATAEVPVSQRRLLEVLAAPEQPEDTSATLHTPAVLTLLGGALLTALAAIGPDVIAPRARRKHTPPPSPSAAPGQPRRAPDERPMMSNR
jgi:hypothetical protein